MNKPEKNAEACEGHTELANQVQDRMLYTIEGNNTFSVEGFSYKIKHYGNSAGIHILEEGDPHEEGKAFCFPWCAFRLFIGSGPTVRCVFLY